MENVHIGSALHVSPAKSLFIVSLKCGRFLPMLYNGEMVVQNY